MIVPEAIEALLQRVRGEHLEMPGLRLTLAQAARLWDLDRATCQLLMHALTHARFLARTADDAYVRADSSPGKQRIPDSVRSGDGAASMERAVARSPATVP